MDNIPVLLKLQTTQQPVELIVRSGIWARYVITDHVLTDILGQSINAAYRVTLHDNSNLELLIALVYVQDCSIKIELDLQGSGAQADVTVLYGLSEQQNIKINTLQKHQGKKTISSFVVRGIVTGQAQVSYRGMISLQPGSAQAGAKQEHTTIVLSKQAKVISIPSIEVLHHDVQCCHGAAIGQFDERQLWYLQSRGFERGDAYKMLAHSFFAEYVGRFSFPFHQRDLYKATVDMVGDKNSFAGQLLESLCQKIL